MAIVDFVFRDFNAHRCATTTKSPRPLFCNQLRFQLASDRIESGKASEAAGVITASLPRYSGAMHSDDPCTSEPLCSTHFNTR
jgi:hypothetical protein